MTRSWRFSGVVWFPDPGEDMPLRLEPRWVAPLIGSTLLVFFGCATGRVGPRPLDFSTVREAGQLEGEWVGGTTVLGGPVLIEARFGRTGGRLSGELRAPSENVTKLPVTDIEVSGAGVSFSFRSPYGLHRATGRWENGMIFGRIEGGGLTGDFHLVPVARPTAAATGRVGSYSMRSGHRLLVTRRAGGGLAWAETEPLEDGAMWIAGGQLYGYSADTLYTDRSIRADPRVHEWLVFHDDSAIEWHPETGPVRVTRRVDRPVEQQEVSFRNGEVELAGTLLLPPGPRPHPAAVLVHGSGPAERTNLLGLLRADLFLRNGIAVLVYDKRGVGGSSGDWERAGIADLAGDASAAVALLRRHPEIEPHAVGLIGHSQAGWVIPAAAALEPGADFMVVLSGGGVSPMDQEIFRARAEATAANLSPSTAVALMQAKWRYAATGQSWDEYVARLSEAGPGVVALTEAIADPDPDRWTLLRQLARYDPLPDLRAISAPALVIFGSDDDNVPIDRAAALWREAVSDSRLTITVAPDVGHALVGLREGRGSIFPAALITAVSAWIESRPWTR